jgi:hypothetical protein
MVSLSEILITIMIMAKGFRTFMTGAVMRTENQYADRDVQWPRSPSQNQSRNQSLKQESNHDAADNGDELCQVKL